MSNQTETTRPMNATKEARTQRDLLAQSQARALMRGETVRVIGAEYASAIRGWVEHYGAAVFIEHLPPCYFTLTLDDEPEAIR